MPFMPIIQVQDRALESTASHINTAVLNLSSLTSAISGAIQDDVAVVVTAINQLTAAVQQQTVEIQKIADAVVEQPPVMGMFNPPSDLVTTINVEIQMSVLELQVGQTAVGKLTFDETTAPPDGAVASDNPAVTIALDPTDHITWTAFGASVTAANTPASCTYSGTSVPPDTGPAIVPPMMVTVVPVPVAEHGDFDPATAVITGP